MTEPANSPTRAFDDIDDVFALLRADGQRVTPAARFVLEALFATGHEEPISAQEIADRAPTELEPSSVYRNLERLEALGVVRHVHLGHGPSLYLLVGAGEREFLLCEECGRARSVDPRELDEVRWAIEDRFGYRAHFGHFPIVGVCRECRGA